MEKDAQCLEATWDRVVRVWWSLMWRCTLFTVIAAFVVGFVAGVVMGFVGRGHSAGTVGAVIGFLISFPVSLWVLRTILQKSFGHFSVRLVAS